MNAISKRLFLIVGAVFAFAAIPSVTFAAGLSPFSASGTIVRVDAGVESVDPTTGGLLTAGQVFTGSLGSSWDGIDGAGITVSQNSLIGIDPSALPTGSSPLQGAAWGGFDISTSNGSLAGSYQASITGTLYLDPFGSIFGCSFTTTLGPIDFTGDGIADPYGAFVSVTDVGDWAVNPNGASGQLGAIHHVGGLLLATAGGCLGGAETASLTLEGQLKPFANEDPDDHDRGKGNDEKAKSEKTDDHGKGKKSDDDDDDHGKGEKSDDDDHGKGKKGDGEKGEGRRGR